MAFVKMVYQLIAATALTALTTPATRRAIPATTYPTTQTVMTESIAMVKRPVTLLMIVWPGHPSTVKTMDYSAPAVRSVMRELMDVFPQVTLVKRDPYVMKTAISANLRYVQTEYVTQGRTAILAPTTALAAQQGALIARIASRDSAMVAVILEKTGRIVRIVLRVIAVVMASVRAQKMAVIVP
jgi:hypothetical protein